MNIDFSKFNYAFQAKPLLVGGRAMEYYQLRKNERFHKRVGPVTYVEIIPS